MSWRPKGSKALSLLRIVELNERWQQLWFPAQVNGKFTDGILGVNLSNTRLKVSGQGIPFGKAKINQLCSTHSFPCPPPPPPAITAKIPMIKISTNKWARVRWTRGSSISLK